MFAESAKDFFDVLRMFGGVVGVDQNVIQIDNNVNVQKVAEDILHETLEGCRGVAEAERHNQHLEKSVAGPEGGLPFVALGDAHQVIGRTKVDLSVDAGLPRSVEKVGNAGERIFILPCDLVQPAEIMTKTESAFLLFNEKDGGTSGRTGRADETAAEVVGDELLQGFMFSFREGVYRTERRDLTIL